MVGFVIQVTTENSTSHYGDWYGFPFHSKEEAERRAERYSIAKGCNAVFPTSKSVTVVPTPVGSRIYEDIDRGNDGS